MSMLEIIFLTFVSKSLTVESEELHAFPIVEKSGVDDVW